MEAKHSMEKNIPRKKQSMEEKEQIRQEKQEALPLTGNSINRRSDRNNGMRRSCFDEVLFCLSEDIKM